jgi:hypothetical protein
MNLRVLAPQVSVISCLKSGLNNRYNDDDEAVSLNCLKNVLRATVMHFHIRLPSPEEANIVPKLINGYCSWLYSCPPVSRRLNLLLLYYILPSALTSTHQTHKSIPIVINALHIIPRKPLIWMYYSWTHGLYVVIPSLPTCWVWVQAYSVGNRIVLFTIISVPIWQFIADLSPWMRSLFTDKLSRMHISRNDGYKFNVRYNN